MSVVESLERREVLSGAGVPFASFPGVVTAKGEAAQVVLHFDAGELSSDRSSSILLGLHAKPTAGSPLVPNISEVDSASGRHIRTNLPRRGSDAAAKALFITSVPLRSGQAQDISVDVTNQNDKVGSFDLEAFLPGDANGDSVVDATDLAIIQGIYGSASGQSNFNPAADFNGDGHVGCIDRQIAELNQGARAIYTPTAPAVTPTAAPAVTPAAAPAVTPTVAPAVAAPIVIPQAVTATPVVLTPVQPTTTVASVQSTPVVVAPIQTTPVATPVYSQANASIPVYAVQTVQTAAPTPVQAPTGYLQSNAAGPIFYSGQPAVQSSGSISLTNQAMMPGVAYYYGQPVVQSPGYNQTLSNQSPMPGVVYYGQAVVQAPGYNPSAMPGVVYYSGQPMGQVPTTNQAVQA